MAQFAARPPSVADAAPPSRATMSATRR